MNLLKKHFGLLAWSVLMAGIFASSCERGVTEGVFGHPMEDPYPHFDTFEFPTANYYFFGKFDGHFKKWQDGVRSKWDTITRKDLNDPDNPNWSSWPLYTANIYRNIPEQYNELPCVNDSDNVWFEHITRFIRPEIPSERVEIFFYDCVNEADFDTIPALGGFHPEVVTYVDFLNKQVAQPFSNYQFGRRGAKLIYTDAERTKWETKEGSGQLEDSYIRITNLIKRNVTQDTLDTLGMYIIEGEFAGRLYNGGRNIPVTEAKFRARLVPREP
jgi:hypothetical protein